MQGLTEFDILPLIVAPAVVLIVWMIPTFVVIRYRSRDDNIDEDSICYRTAKFSKNHPVLLTIIVSTPALVLILVLSPMFDLLFISLFQVIFGFTIVTTIVAWRTKDFPW